MYKKLISLLCVLCLLAVSVVPASAVQAPEDAVCISEYHTDDNEIVRVLDKRSISNTVDRKVMADYLAELGVDQQAIVDLSEDDWVEIENSPRITTITAYKKTDVNGQRVTITEEEAISIASTYIPPVDEVVETDCLKLVILIVQMGDDPGGFKITTSARWLTMPFVRWYDSIGLCVSGFNVYSDTYAGYYHYDLTQNWHYTGTSNSQLNMRTTFDLDDFQTQNNGGFIGVGVAFCLPSDAHSQISSTLISDFYVQMSVKGRVDNPNSQSVFEATSTYCHQSIGISIGLPQLSISLSGVDASFSIGVEGIYENTCAKALVLYTP